MRKAARQTGDTCVISSPSKPHHTMPDASHSLKRRRGGSAGHPTKSSGTQRDSLPCVVAGLLRGQPELTLLTKAASGLAKIELVQDRFALVSTVLATRPGVLVIPPFDADHTSTAPLVLRVRREAPGVAVLVLSNHPGGAGQPMVRAAQAGAHVITLPTATQLHEALTSLLDRPGGSGPPGARQ